MVRSEEGIVHEEIISVLKQLEEEGKMLDKNVKMCYFIFNHNIFNHN